MAPFAYQMARVALSTLAIYLYLVIGLRLVARRSMGQLTVVDLVIITILGSAVETAMIRGDVSLVAGLVSASALLVVNRLFALALDRSRRLRRFVVGGPVLLVHNGKIIPEHLRQEGLTQQDLAEALRERGWSDPSQVRFAVLEPDGTINAIGQKPRA